MQVYKAIVQKVSSSILIFVLTDNENSVNNIVRKSIALKEIEFNDEDGFRIEINKAIPVEINEFTVDNIQKIGIINKEGILIDGNIADILLQLKRGQEKEDYLRKNHMEFNFEL